MSQLENNNTIFSLAIINELLRNNINTFIISPGSRSTPLTVAIARFKNEVNIKSKNKEIIKTIVAVDERSAAFYALGYARHQQNKDKINPAVLICTSGSAVANYLPAVIEASQDFIPMIIISADRPSELLDTGANQAIDQKNIFQNYVRKNINIQCPSNELPLKSILTNINNSIYHAQNGPIHINIMFREPLIPHQLLANKYLKKQNTQQAKPYTQYFYSLKTPSNNTLKKIDKILSQKKKTILVIGRLQSKKKLKQIIKFAEKYNLPIFADVLSQLRNFSSTNIISYFHHVIPLLAKQNPPQNIIHLGGQITSKTFLKLLETNSFENYIVVKSHSQRHDVTHKVTHRIQADIPIFCKKMISISKKKPSDKKSSPSSVVEYLTYLQIASANIRSNIHNFMNKKTLLNEVYVVRSLIKTIKNNSSCFLGNSLSIRMVDYFAYNYNRKNQKKIFFDANRGSSGIDGNLSTGLGYAKSSQKNTIILLGDLSLLHDLNALYLLETIKTSVTIIAVNNNGGGIFQYLPIQKYKDVFEEFFIVPHNLQFKNICQMFSLKYSKIQTQKEFDKALQENQKNNEHRFLEVFVNGKESFNFYEELQNHI